MKRRQLFELEDLPWWPQIFRDGVTDYLATGICLTKGHLAFAPRLAAALKRSGSVQITDLCSGAGGPWPELLADLRASDVRASLCFTDKYPNRIALARLVHDLPGARFEPESVSATDVPPRLAGFRTLFTSFHHFRPEAARAILKSAVRESQGIAIFEGASRSLSTLALLLLVPFTVWLITPLIRPFRWARLFWTYIVPVIPLAATFDGIVSGFRFYTPEEMLSMGHEVDGDSFVWEAGYERAGRSLIRMPYLIGIPAPRSERNPSIAAGQERGLYAASPNAD